MKVALTGASGHMGFPVLKEFVKLEEVETIRVLLEAKQKRNKLVKNLAKNYKGKIEILVGDVSNIDDVRLLAEGVSYYFNLAGVIPSRSDFYPHLSYLANEVGVKNAITVCLEKDIKLIDITTVALYCHRTEAHPFARIGDPIMPSPYDPYAMHKARGELAILESDLANFVIIRQTAMIYPELMTSNMKDGLMFHTCFNEPFEWSTSGDSARLLVSLIKEDVKGHLNHDNFWNKVFNLGDGEHNRLSGFDTIDGGFSLFGGKAKDFFEPHFSIARNFHGGFYYDGDELDKLFHYQKENYSQYWDMALKQYPYIKLARFVPKKLIKKFAIMRLFKYPNSPDYWYKHNDIARLTAYFGGKEEYERLPTKWEDYNLIDYTELKKNENYIPIDYGFDINKSDKDITKKDLDNVALMHGGKLLEKEFKTGDVYKKVLWENQDGEQFYFKPYTVLRGGHWYNPIYKENKWDFDRLAKKDKIFAAHWYDSHKKDEDHVYIMDDNYQAVLK